MKDFIIASNTPLFEAVLEINKVVREKYNRCGMIRMDKCGSGRIRGTDMPAVMLDVVDEYGTRYPEYVVHASSYTSVSIYHHPTRLPQTKADNALEITLNNLSKAHKRNAQALDESDDADTELKQFLLGERSAYETMIAHVTERLERQQGITRVNPHDYVNPNAKSEWSD